MEKKSRFGEDGRGGNGAGAEKGPPGRAADIVFSYYKNSGPEGCPLGCCWRSRDGAIGGTGQGQGHGFGSTSRFEAGGAVSLVARQAGGAVVISPTVLA